MRDDYGHEFQRWGVCRRCGCDHGDLKATDPCPGELPDLQTQPMPVVRPLPAGSQRGQPLTERPTPPPNGPSRRRRRVEDIALIDFALRVSEHMGGAVRLHDAPLILDAFQQGVAPDDIDWPVEDGYVHNPNCGGTCGDRCNG